MNWDSKTVKAAAISGLLAGFLALYLAFLTYKHPINNTTYRITVYDFDPVLGHFVESRQYLIPARQLKLADSGSPRLIFTAEGENISRTGTVFRIEKVAD